MNLNSKTVEDYYLLRNYTQYTFTARGLLLKMDFDAIKRIDESNWIVSFDKPDSEEAKKMIKSTIQIEIISKIMMYIEDLVIISESLRQGKTYYDLLPQPSEKREDIGDLVKQFFERIDSLSDIDVRKILSYTDPESYELSSEDTELLQRALKEDAKEFRRILKQLDKFGKEHHPIFRRYKHAGFPILPNVPFKNGLPEFYNKFDLLSMIYVNADPYNNPKIIPYSKIVLEGYVLLIAGIQRLLTEIMNNRITSMERKIDGIPPLASFSSPFFKVDELKRISEIQSDLNKKFPIQKLDFNIKMTNEFVNYSDWYSELDNFILECKNRDKTDRKYREEYERYKQNS